MPERINVPGLIRLPAFCHATRAGDFVYVAGTLGTVDEKATLAAGGTGPETEQTLRNIEKILEASGARLEDIVKVNVFLADLDTFAEMNEARAIRDGGGFGSIIGRNSFQRKKPDAVKLLKNIMAVYTGETK